MRNANRFDALAVCGGERRYGLANRVARGFPPADRIVLVAVHRGRVQLNVALRGVQHVSSGVNDDRFGGRGGRVDSNNKGASAKVVLIIRRH